MTEEQQAKKYISDLKYPIQEYVIFHDMFSVDETHNKTMKIKSYKVELHLLGDRHSLRRHKLEQTVNCRSTGPLH